LVRSRTTPEEAGSALGTIDAREKPDRFRSARPEPSKASSRAKRGRRASLATEGMASNRDHEQGAAVPVEARLARVPSWQQTGQVLVRSRLTLDKAGSACGAIDPSEKADRFRSAPPEPLNALSRAARGHRSSLAMRETTRDRAFNSSAKEPEDARPERTPLA
jgi:hypothetical protein